MQVKHVSLDFWNTVGIPNEEFAKKRRSFLEKQALSLNKSYAIQSIEKIYKRCKNELDGLAMLGIGFDTYTNWNILFNRLGFKQALDLEGIIEKYKVLFEENPPFILDEIKDSIQAASNRGITFNILSNTNFASGRMILKTISDKEIPISFYLFSDEYRMAKPNIKFFSKVCEKTSVPKKNILHIGDSQECDEVGACQIGFQFQKVKSPYELANIINNL